MKVNPPPNSDRFSSMSSKRAMTFVFVGLQLGWLGVGCTAGQLDASISEAATEIDRLLQQSWNDGVAPAPISGDAEFCRRVWLDLGGVAPPVAEVRRFLADTAADKRAVLVDQLLASTHHARHMASRWTDILLPPDGQDAAQDNVAALNEWLRGQFSRNLRYDYLVGGFLTAGGAGNSGPAVFYTSHALEPEKLAAATSKIFMGIQLQCAQCHDHPFDKWTQKDFWSYAAFFGQLTQSNPGIRGEVIIEDRPGGEVMLPDTDQTMLPRYPGTSEPPEKDPGNIRRRQLTIWMASRDNPYFARAAVNRVWGHLFGRGLVDPVDAMDASNRPSHPELLDFLAAYFTSRRFDLRTLYATLARTEAYQRTSAVAAEARPAEDTFASMIVKTLSAEQVYDSMQQNVFRRSPPRRRNDRRQGPAGQDAFLRQQFLARMKASDASPREYPHGVVQALGMMNGPEVLQATTTAQSGLLASLEAPFFSDTDRIETLFLSTLSRQPTRQEADRFGQYVAAGKAAESKQAALSDVLWMLLNTAEFVVCP